MVKKRINISDINTELELLKQEVKNIKDNDLYHIGMHIDSIKADVKVVKKIVYKAQYIMYGAITAFVVMSEKFSDILRLL